MCVSRMTNYMNFKVSKDVEKNPGPTQYNTDHHEVIIRPFMQNVQFMRDNPGRFIESNTENSWLRYLNNMSIQGTWADATYHSSNYRCIKSYYTNS